MFFIPVWKVEFFYHYVFGCPSEKSYENTILELTCYTQTMG